MKRVLFILGWSILIGLLGSCHQNIKVGAKETNLLAKKDSVEPDSIVLVKDTLLSDSLVVEPFVERSYEQVFFKDKPYAVKVLVFEVRSPY